MRLAARKFNERRINRLVGKIARHKHAHPEAYEARLALIYKHAKLQERLGCCGAFLSLLLLEYLR